MWASLILDLLHVLEKVREAAPVFHPEGSPQAELFARLMCLRILEGKVCQVVKGPRQTVTKRRLFGARRKRSGLPWTESMAEAIVKLRAV